MGSEIPKELPRKLSRGEETTPTEYMSHHHLTTSHDPIITKVALDVIGRAANFLVYPGASYIKDKIIDPERTIEAKKQLKLMGGESVKMQTPDGDTIDGMYLNAEKFKENINKYFEVIETEIPQQPGHFKQSLVLKVSEGIEKGWCRELKTDKGVKIELIKGSEAEKFYHAFSKLGVRAIPFAEHPNNPNIRCPVIPIGTAPKELFIDAPSEEKGNSHPTALIVGGSGMSYTGYKGLAAAYLMRGMNVMLFDMRGYGESTGRPTETKTYADIETCYHYLQDKRDLKNEDLLIHGHCLGGGPAAHLAAKESGTNLLLDRTFAEYREIVREKYPIIGSVLHKVMPAVVNYNPAAKLEQVQGHIMLVEGTKDAVISTEQQEKLKKSIPENASYQILRAPVEHTGTWTDDVQSGEQLNQFLERANLRRQLFSPQ